MFHGRRASIARPVSLPTEVNQVHGSICANDKLKQSAETWQHEPGKKACTMTMVVH